MRHYHPIRAEKIDKLEASRKAHTKAQLQVKMLQLLTSKAVSVPDLAKDRSHQLQQRAEEGFDDDSSSAWREEVLANINTARHLFKDGGRNIYDMTLISPMFVNVDVDDLVLDEVSLPFEAIYLHFGVGAQLSFESDRWIEGVYASESPDDGDAIRFTFVCNHPDFQVADATPLGITYKRVTTAISTTLRKDVKVRHALSEAGITGDPAILSSGITVTSALRMAINGLLYLNLPHPDIEFGYDREAPSELIRIATTGPTSNGKRAKLRLEEDGYIQVNFCGRNTISVGTPSPSGGSGSAKAAHWRRGHWRRVAVGEGRTGREWRLIEPTIVNKGSGTVPLGRIHIVRPAVGRAPERGE
jgi:hypothetical protein